MPSDVHILGIRHHGPGSARAVARALAQVRPDVVLIEGSPELEAILPLAASPEIRPPVAGFVYLRDQPRHAVFAPFASFSPEWVAMKYGLTQQVPVRFIDLPAAAMLVASSAAAAAASAEPVEPENISAELDSESAEPGNEQGEPGNERLFEATNFDRLAADPLGMLAELAGYDDREAWWEDVIEHRRHGLSHTGPSDHLEDNPLAVFSAVSAAMRQLRASARLGTLDGEHLQREEQREASMRTGIRNAIKQGFARIAVVCGAWHSPALEPDSFPAAAADAAVLKGLPKASTVATWVPWTHGRLASSSGYGAGVRSPGWYHYLHSAQTDDPEEIATGWVVLTAQLLRSEGLDASPASVIESVRLATALAALRGRPVPGLTELDDASLAVLAQGSTATLQLIRKKLVVGDLLGAVPAETPTVPIAQDLADQQKRLRLKVRAQSEIVGLDLRKPNDLAKSHLFHRLRLLDINWAQPAGRQGRATGTFHETWQTEWQPELSVALVEASMYGTTVESAATAKVTELATTADLARLAELVEQSLLADLSSCVGALVSSLQRRVASQSDVGTLMDSVAPLVRIARYGDVRRTDTDAVREVLKGLLARVCAGVSGQCASLDDEAAVEMRLRIEAVHQGVTILNDSYHRDEWSAALLRISAMATAHGLVAGRCVRILRDGLVIPDDQAGAELSRALSRGTDAVQAAQWIEGFLAGDVGLLLHDRQLLSILDEWVCRVAGPLFDDVIPLLRRTFGQLSKVDRRHLAHRLFTADSPAMKARPTQIDASRADAALPRFLSLLGMD